MRDYNVSPNEVFLSDFRTGEDGFRARSKSGRNIMGETNVSEVVGQFVVFETRGLIS